MAKEPALDRLLSTFTVTQDQVEAMASTRIVWRRVIALSHLSVWAAPANGGKTTIAKLAAAELAAAGHTVLYFQEDASAGDLAVLFSHAKENGYRLLNSTLANANPEDQIELLQELVRDDVDLSDWVMFFDTLKKYTDLMSKSGARTFFKLLRSLTLRGCTIVALGHTNKHVGIDGNMVFEGVGDVRNDVDELFYIETVRDERSGLVTMTMKPDKWRCTVAEATFELDTHSMDLRVLPEPVDVPAMRRRSKQRQEDAEIIQAVTNALRQGGMNKGRLVERVMQSAGVGKRTATNVVDRYSSPDPAEPAALWVDTFMRFNNTHHITLKPITELDDRAPSKNVISGLSGKVGKTGET